MHAQQRFYFNKICMFITSLIQRNRSGTISRHKSSSTVLAGNIASLPPELSSVPCPLSTGIDGQRSLNTLSAMCSLVYLGHCQKSTWALFRFLYRKPKLQIYYLYFMFSLILFSRPYIVHNVLVNHVEFLKEVNCEDEPRVFRIFPFGGSYRTAGDVIALITWYFMVVYPCVAIPVSIFSF